MPANLAFVTEVEEAIAAGSPSQRNRILRRVTDLFILNAEHYSDEELDLFDDVFLRLVEEIETSARALLAIRLAPVRNAPPGVVRLLALDNVIDVAGPMLRQSIKLDDAVLVEAATTRSQEHMLAISKRDVLSTRVTDVLIERGDRDVLLSTVDNRGASFSDTGMETLVRRADGDDQLTLRVGFRPEIPPRLYLKLLAKASAEVRSKLEAAYPYAKNEVRNAVAEVTNRIKSLVPASERPEVPDDARIEGTGRSVEEEVVTLLRRGRRDDGMAAMAASARLPFSFIKRAFDQDRPDTILVLARALGWSWPTVKVVLTSRQKRPPISGSEAERLMNSFERLNSNTAREIVSYYRKIGEASLN